jgi:hypothetical protein
VRPTTRLKVEDVGYERAEFVIAHSVIPDAPKTSACRSVGGILSDLGISGKVNFVVFRLRDETGILESFREKKIIYTYIR